MHGTPRVMQRPTLSALSTVALCGLAVIVAWGFWGYSYDDAFITYRYARTWLEQGALRYNQEEVVLGTTAPGYALVLGALARLSAPFGLTIPQWGTVISVGSIVGIAAALARCAGADGRTRAIVLLAFGVAALGLRWNIELLGTEFFPATALAVLGSVWLLRSASTILPALVLSAAAILRFELALAGLAAGAVWTWQRGRLSASFVTALFLPSLLYLLWLRSSFGAVIPVSLETKHYGLSLIEQSYATAQWAWLRRTLPLAGCVTLLALALTGLVTALAQRSTHRVLVLAGCVWLAAHEAVYRILGVPFAPWYHVPTLLGVLFLAALGAERCAVVLADAIGKRESSLVRLGATAALLAPLLAPSYLYVGSQWGRPPDPRLRIYSEVAELIRRSGPPNALVATVEIGVLGYDSRRPILDLIGLVSPPVLQARRDRRLPQLVADAAPRYIVYAARFGGILDPILQHDDVRGRYRRVRQFETAEYGEPVQLLERFGVGTSSR